MKTILLLNGDCDAKKSFHDVIKNNFEEKVFEVKKFSKQDNFLTIGMSPNEIFYEGFSEHFERITDLGNEICVEVIEGYNRELSKMIQDDYPIFEILLVDKMGVLSNTAFCLNWKSETFKEEAIELITKLAF